MKQTTQEILTILNGEVLNKRKTFVSLSETLGIASAQVGDQTFSQLISSLNDAIDTLNETINKNIIDSLSSSTRDLLKTYVSDLNNKANELFLVKTTTDITPFRNVASNILNFIDQYSLELQLKNIPDYKTKLSEIKQLQEKLWRLNSDYEKSKAFIDKSEEQFKNISEKYSQSASTQTELKTIIDNANSLYTQLGESKTKIQEHINEIQKFYSEQYKTLHEATVKGKEELEATSKFVTEKHDEIKLNAEHGVALFMTLTNTVAQYEKVLNTLTQTNTTIQELFTKVNDPENGVEKKFSVISETKIKVDDLYSKSAQSFNIIREYEIKIDAILKDSTDKLKNITESKQKVDETLEYVNNIYGIIADTAMGGEFNKKAKESADDFTNWGKKNIYYYNTIIYRDHTIVFITLFLF